MKLNNQKKLNFEFKGEFSPGLGEGSSMNLLFKHLSNIDESFRLFLQKRHINPENPYSDDAILQKSIFLKYKVDAIYRLIYT